MKSYTLGNHGFVPTPVRVALGQPVGHNQATVIIVAETKVKAVDLADAVGITINRHDSELRIADGWAVADQLRELGQRAVYVLSKSGSCRDVLRLEPGQGPRIVGTSRGGAFEPL